MERLDRLVIITTMFLNWAIFLRISEVGGKFEYAGVNNSLV